MQNPHALYEALCANPYEDTVFNAFKDALEESEDPKDRLWFEFISIYMETEAQRRGEIPASVENDRRQDQLTVRFARLCAERPEWKMIPCRHCNGTGVRKNENLESYRFHGWVYRPVLHESECPICGGEGDLMWCVKKNCRFSYRFMELARGIPNRIVLEPAVAIDTIDWKVGKPITRPYAHLIASCKWAPIREIYQVGWKPNLNTTRRQSGSWGWLKGSAVRSAIHDTSRLPDHIWDLLEPDGTHTVQPKSSWKYYGSKEAAVKAAGVAGCKHVRKWIEEHP